MLLPRLRPTLLLVIFAALGGCDGDAARTKADVENGSDTGSVPPAVARRRSDSLQVLSLLTAGRALTRAEWLTADSLIHQRKFNIAHDEGHAWVAGERLRMAGDLLRPGPKGYGDPKTASNLLGMVHPPLSDGQADELRRLNSLAVDERAKQRIDDRLGTAQGWAPCKRPSRAKMKKVLADHGEWDDELVGLIACGDAKVGMTKDQLIASRDFPNEGYGAVELADGRYERWVYNDGGHLHTTIYIAQDRVTAVQHSAY